MTEHKRVITCSCGDTFNSEDTFKRHKERKKRTTFNERVQWWLDEHMGGTIAQWHSELRHGCGMAAYQTAKENGMPTDPTDENVRQAAIQFARDSLADGNKEQLFRDSA